ncbi:choice-of-anchor D domain-containing protein [bacterium]|nr:choice-of-anchor D domain-containing protein [bacterium]
MKRFAIAFVALLTTVSMSFAFSGGPPQGRAGDPPGNANCTVCHSSFGVNSGDGSLTISEILEYEPGETYDLTVSLTDDGQSRWGFQAIPKDGSNATAGALVISDGTNTQANGDYINHTSTGTNAGSTTGNSWDFQWTAPAAGTGDVTFYVAGNAANNNFSTSGDYIYTISMTIPEAAGGGEADINTNVTTLDFGEVTVGIQLTINLPIQNTGDAELSITDIVSDTDEITFSPAAPFQVAAGEEELWQVRFQPTMEQEYSGTITITSNDPDEGSYEITVNGTGVAANVAPEAFTLLTPTDGATVNPDGPIEFSWEGSNDPDSEEAVVFTLQVSENDDFSTFVFNEELGAFTGTVLNDPGLTDGETYFWRVIAADDEGLETNSTDTFSFTAQTNSVGEEGVLPGSWAIASAYPNPFNPSLNVVIESPNSSPVTVAVYDMLGRQVTTLHQGALGSGSHTMTWTPTGSAGVYLVVAKAQGWSATRKVVYMK